MGGMFISFFMILHYISDDLTFGEAVNVAGALNKLDAVDWSFDLKKRYCQYLFSFLVSACLAWGD